MLSLTSSMVLTSLLMSLDGLTAAPAPILFVVQAQKGAFHADVAERTRTSILKQWSVFVPPHVMDPPQVILTTELEEDLVDRAWTYFPLFDFLAERLETVEGIEWVAILNENTELNLRSLGEYAKNQQGRLNPTKESLFFGKAMRDAEAVIIHHFHVNTPEKTVIYPDTESGFFFSRHLVLSLKGRSSAPSANLDFHIDPSFELANFLLTELQVGLTHVPQLCSKKNSAPECITFPRQEYKCIKNKAVEMIQQMLDSVYVLVSTCKKYHDTRVPVVQQTWADVVPNLQFISDEVDESIPTEVLPYTINTELGFCNKTRTMLDRFLEEKHPWLLITDDDTVLSPFRFGQLLACYNTEEPTILGQRYGYRTAGGGYNYVTGGGGKVINRAAAEALVADGCPCPAPDTPEDMHIFGICAKRGGIAITHSGRMFQGRPNDYPSALVSYRKPVSFHKHWNIDPVQVYEEWFRKADDPLRSKVQPKTEL